MLESHATKVNLPTEELILNYKYYDLSAIPDPFFWLREIGSASINGDRQAEAFLVEVMTKSLNKEKQMLAYIYIKATPIPLQETKTAAHAFRADAHNIVLVEEIVLAGKAFG